MKHCNFFNYPRFYGTNLLLLRWLKKSGFQARGRTTHVKVTGMLIVSLRDVNCIFWSHIGTESHYIFPFRYRIGLCMKKFTKNAVTEISFGLRGHLSYTHTGLPYWFNFNFPTSIPPTCIWKSPRNSKISRKY